MDVLEEILGETGRYQQNRDQDLKEQLHLMKETTSGRIFGKTSGWKL
jgi:hypothetical protein